MPRAVIFVLATAVWVPTSLSAQATPADVCAASRAHYEAIRAGDLETVFDQHAPAFDFYMHDGSPLARFATHDEQRAALEDPTFRADAVIEGCTARLFGDVGVATFTLDGTMIVGGETRTGPWRVTEVWVRDGDRWLETHHHESRLVEPGGSR